MESFGFEVDMVVMQDSERMKEELKRAVSAEANWLKQTLNSELKDELLQSRLQNKSWHDIVEANLKQELKDALLRELMQIDRSWRDAVEANLKQEVKDALSKEGIEIRRAMEEMQTERAFVEADLQVERGKVFRLNDVLQEWVTSMTSMERKWNEFVVVKDVVIPQLQAQYMGLSTEVGGFGEDLNVQMAKLEAGCEEQAKFFETFDVQHREMRDLLVTQEFGVIAASVAEMQARLAAQKLERVEQNKASDAKFTEVKQLVMTLDLREVFASLHEVKSQAEKWQTECDSLFKRMASFEGQHKEIKELVLTQNLPEFCATVRDMKAHLVSLEVECDEQKKLLRTISEQHFEMRDLVSTQDLRDVFSNLRAVNVERLEAEGDEHRTALNEHCKVSELFQSNEVLNQEVKTGAHRTSWPHLNRGPEPTTPVGGGDWNFSSFHVKEMQELRRNIELFQQRLEADHQSLVRHVRRLDMQLCCPAGRVANWVDCICGSVWPAESKSSGQSATATVHNGADAVRHL